MAVRQLLLSILTNTYGLTYCLCVGSCWRQELQPTQFTLFLCASEVQRSKLTIYEIELADILISTS